ncbi:hypothetical protein, partial [Streptomyces sp. NPDC059452]|uniref:hypothetical protein n=1 Tax=Streptomyces sp. NPDC059452 TaxID=3346835 RepID=UPI00369879FE
SPADRPDRTTRRLFHAPEGAQHMGFDLTTIGKKLGYAEDDIAAVKKELVGVAHSVNLLKPELNGIVAEAVGANFGVKLFNAEHTFFDLKEMQAKARGEDPGDLKARIDKIGGGSSFPAEDGGLIGQHKAKIAALEEKTTNARRAADRAQATADGAKRGASRANSGVARIMSGAGRTGIRPATPQADITEVRQAASAINVLENRVNELVRALS